MKTPNPSATRPSVPLKNLQRAVSDGTRWRILELLLQNGAMTTMYVAKGVRASMQNTSKHLILLRDLGLIEQRMGRLYEIPQAFIVPGERALDYGPIVLRFGEQK